MLPQEMLDRYDGSNGLEVFRIMEARGVFISAMPDPQTWAGGIISHEELEVVRDVLRPAERRIVKAHLLRVVEDGDGEGSSGLAMVLRPVAKTGAEAGAGAGAGAGDGDGDGDGAILRTALADL